MKKKITEIRTVNCMGVACPTVFKTDKKTYIIIGKSLNRKIKEVERKIGDNEIAIEVPVDLLNF